MVLAMGYGVRDTFGPAMGPRFWRQAMVLAMGDGVGMFVMATVLAMGRDVGGGLCDADGPRYW